MTKTKRYDYFDGLNRGVNPFLMKDSELMECLNLYTKQIGSKTKRPGYDVFLDKPDTSKVRNLIYFEKGNGTTKRMLRVSGTSIYVYSFTGSTWGSAAKTISSTTNRMSSAVLSGKILLTDGVNTVSVYDGTTFTNVSTAPVGRYAVTFNRRVLIWGVAGNPDRLYASKVDDPTDWTINANDPSAAQYWDVDPDSSGDLTGGTIISRRLTLFKPKSVYRFDGADFMKVPTSEGLSSQAGLISIEDMMLYPNRAGVYAFIGDKPVPISDFIKDYYAGIASAEWDESVGSLAAGAWGSDHYLLSVGNITDTDGKAFNNAILVYNQRINQWYLWSFANRPYSWVTCPDTNDAEQLYFGDDVGNTYVFNSGNDDNGTPISTSMVTKPLLETEKNYILKHLLIRAKQSTTAKVLYDFFDGNWKPLGDIKGAVTIFHFPITAKGRSPRIKIADSGSNSGHTIYIINLAYDEVPGDWWAR